jgi:hypothetical protein
MADPDCHEDIGRLFAEVENLKEWKREFERKEAARMIAEAAKLAASLKAEGFRDGAVWALAKVGAVVVTALSAVGYVTIHGFPEWLKSVFR